MIGTNGLAFLFFDSFSRSLLDSTSASVNRGLACSGAKPLTPLRTCVRSVGPDHHARLGGDGDEGHFDIRRQRLDKACQAGAVVHQRIAAVHAVVHSDCQLHRDRHRFDFDDLLLDTVFRHQHVLGAKVGHRRAGRVAGADVELERRPLRRDMNRLSDDHRHDRKKSASEAHAAAPSEGVVPSD